MVKRSKSRASLIVAEKARIQAALERALFNNPDPRRAVTGAGDDACAVGREGGAMHPFLMAQDGDLRPGASIPDPRRAVYRCGDDAGAVGREGGAIHLAFMAAENLGQASLRRLRGSHAATDDQH